MPRVWLTREFYLTLYTAILNGDLSPDVEGIVLDIMAADTDDRAYHAEIEIATARCLQEVSIGAADLVGCRHVIDDVIAICARYGWTAERWSIWSHAGEARIRQEHCDLVPPSDDDRALQAAGWPNASEQTPEDGITFATP